MKIPALFKKPITIAITLHAAVLLFLIFNFLPTQFRYPTSASAPTKIIQASAISNTAVESEVHAIQTAKAIQAQKVQAEKKAAAEKTEAIKQAKIALAMKIRKAEEKAQQKAEKIKQAKIAAQKEALATQLQKKKLSVEQKKLQQALMQQQLQNEKKEMLDIQTQQNNGVIDKYKAEILSLIQSNWRIPAVNDQLKCVYAVNVAPGGVVLSVKLVKSSGDAALDQSARTAITQSSPLPVPSESNQFDHFRQLILTLSPQGYIRVTG